MLPASTFLYAELSNYVKITAKCCNSQFIKKSFEQSKITLSVRFTKTVVYCRRGGPGCGRSTARVVCHHVARDLQPELCAVHDRAAGSRHVYHQLPVLHKPGTSVLLQVCGTNNRQGNLRQQAAGMLLHTKFLQTHRWRACQVSPVRHPTKLWGSSDVKSLSPSYFLAFILPCQ